MIAKDIMTRDVITVTPTMTVKALAMTLIKNQISGAPVADKNGKIVGVVSESDIVAKKGKQVGGHRQPGRHRERHRFRKTRRAPHASLRSLVRLKVPACSTAFGLLSTSVNLLPRKGWALLNQFTYLKKHLLSEDWRQQLLAPCDSGLHHAYASVTSSTFLTKLAKHLALLACLMIVGQVADQSVIGKLGIFLTIVVAAVSHSTGIALRRR